MGFDIFLRTICARKFQWTNSSAYGALYTKWSALAMLKIEFLLFLFLILLYLSCFSINFEFAFLWLNSWHVFFSYFFYRLRCNLSSNVHRKIFTVFWSMDCNKQSIYSSWYRLSRYLYKFNPNIWQQTSSNWCFSWNASWSNHWIFVCVCCSSAVC